MYTTVEVEVELINRTDKALIVTNFCCIGQPKTIMISQVKNWVELYDRELLPGDNITLEMCEKHAFNKELI
jgi:hypothetical protein